MNGTGVEDIIDAFVVVLGDCNVSVRIMEESSVIMIEGVAHATLATIIDDLAKKAKPCCDASDVYEKVEDEVDSTGIKTFAKFICLNCDWKHKERLERAE